MNKHNKVDFRPAYQLKTPKLQFNDEELAAFYFYYYSSFSANAEAKNKHWKSPRTVVDFNFIADVFVSAKAENGLGKDTILRGLFFFMENNTRFKEAAKAVEDKFKYQFIFDIHHLGGFNFVTADLDSNFSQKMHRHRFSRRQQEKIYELKLTLYYLPDLTTTQADRSARQVEEEFIAQYPDISPKTYYIRNGNIIKVNNLYYKVVFMPNALLWHQRHDFKTGDMAKIPSIIKMYWQSSVTIEIDGRIISGGSGLVFKLIRPDSLPASMPRLPFINHGN